MTAAAEHMPVAVAREALDTQREALKILTAIVDRNPNGRKKSGLTQQASAMLLDRKILDDRISEAGGKAELVFLICAQVSGGVSLKDWCAHYSIDRGLVGALLCENDEWFEAYQRALRLVADEYVAEMVPIADDADPATVKVANLRIKTRESVAQFYDPKRFGSAKSATAPAASNVIDAALNFAAAELLNRIARPSNSAVEKVVSEQ